jgi:hypothetical protein
MTNSRSRRPRRWRHQMVTRAAVVNAHAALLQRTETCQRIRHRLPNLVAVDFYQRGDVLGAVGTLNGISP